MSAPRASLLLLAAFALTAGNALSAETGTDAAAASVVGPAVWNGGATLQVAAQVRVAGAFPAAGVTLEVVLSADEAIDGGDVRVGHFVAPNAGTFTIQAKPPLGLEGGDYRLGLRIPALPGELDLANNVCAGTPVTLLQAHPHFVEPAPLVIHAAPLEPAVALDLAITASGPTGVPVPYFAYPASPVPWLLVTPGEGVAVAGTLSTLSLLVDGEGLAPGTYTTELVLQDAVVPAVFSTMPVTLAIGPAKLQPGDRIQGTLDPTEAHVFAFEAVPGMKLIVEAEAGGTPLSLSVQPAGLQPQGQVPAISKSLAPKAGAKRIFKTAEAGTHWLRIEPKAGATQTTSYSVRTARKLPKNALPSLRKLKALAMAPCALLKGATLGVVVKAEGAEAATLMLLTPAGQPLDLSHALTSPAENTLELAPLPVPATGVFHLAVDNLLAKKAKVLLVPAQPAVGTATLVLP